MLLFEILLDHYVFLLELESTDSRCQSFLGSSFCSMEISAKPDISSNLGWATQDLVAQAWVLRGFEKRNLFQMAHAFCYS